MAGGKTAAAKDADRAFSLRAQSARIRAYLPVLKERRVVLTAELHELENLIRAERAELVKLMDEADQLGPVKLCPRCLERKTLAEFGKNRAAYDGVDSYCRPCRKTYRLEARTTAA